MKLAADPVTIEIVPGEAFELRPTLLAAMRLTRKHGDFAKLYSRLQADHIGAIEDVIREGTGSARVATMFVDCWDSGSIRLRTRLAAVKPALIAFVAQLAGIDDDQPGDAPSSGKPMPFAEFYVELFTIGTGALGWTPADTWAATPAEIIAAHRGRVKLIGDILKAIFPSSKEDAEPEAPEPLALNEDGTDAAFDRAGYASLRAKFQKAAV